MAREHWVQITGHAALDATPSVGDCMEIGYGDLLSSEQVATCGSATQTDIFNDSLTFPYAITVTHISWIPAAEQSDNDSCAFQLVDYDDVTTTYGDPLQTVPATSPPTTLAANSHRVQTMSATIPAMTRIGMLLNDGANLLDGAGGPADCGSSIGYAVLRIGYVRGSFTGETE
jgi:hypothetical protein